MIVGKVLIFCALLGFVGITARRYSRRRYKNPEEGPYFEGDMIITKAQLRNIQSYNGLPDKRHHWPNATVVYKLSKKFSKRQVGFIKKAMENIERVSCLKFVEKTSHHKHFVDVITRFRGCHSVVGYNRKYQIVNLQTLDKNQPVGCFRHGVIIHEFLHSLGFYHMHNSHDRDKYVTIVWKNIRRKKKSNFIKYSNRQVSHFGEEYDYGSVMHYSRKAFTTNFQNNTIVPHDPKARIGQRKGMSKIDIKRLNKMYECSNECNKK